MYLEDILTWIQTLPITFEHYIASEKMPENKEVLGVFILKKEDGKPIRSLGLQSTTYAISNIRLLVQSNGPGMAAQRKAVDLYRCLEETTLNRMNDVKIVSTTLLNQEPQPHDKDENKGTYEIDFSLIYER